MALNENIDSNASAPVALNKGNPYHVNPYDGDILPSLSDGSKLFLAATKSLDEDKRWDSTSKMVSQSSLIYSR